MTTKPITLALVRIAELAAKDGAVPINGLPGCWERVIDGDWTVAVNGHPEAVKHGDVTVPPFEAYVTFRGWPAGFVGPFGGVLAAGSAGNEDALIAAIERLLA